MDCWKNAELLSISIGWCVTTLPKQPVFVRKEEAQIQAIIFDFLMKIWGQRFNTKTTSMQKKQLPCLMQITY